MMKNIWQLAATLAQMGTVGAATAMALDMAGADHAGTQQTTAAGAYHGTGTIQALKDGKVTIAHNPIEALHWPAMVMDFAVKKPAMLHVLMPGRKISFDFRRLRDRSLEILSARPFR